MTDTKPARARCPHCKISFFNDPIDIDAHGKYCPVLLARKITNLESKNKNLTERIADLEDVEAPATPVDLEDVEELTEDDIDTTDYDDDDDPRSTYLDDEEDTDQLAPFTNGNLT
jgi:hypothetical protein